MTSQSLPKIYLIAGATRGIGLALVDDIAKKDPTAIIYAGGRNISASPQLAEVAARYPGRVEIVKYIAGDAETNNAIAKTIREAHGRVDTVIANAGINNYGAPIHEYPAEQFKEHFAVNTLGPIVLFQSVYTLLQASSSPRFVPVTSMGGSIKLLENVPKNICIAGYSTSKTALNWVTRKIHFENEWLVAFPICPGSVSTDMGNDFVKNYTGGQLSVSWQSPDVAAGMVVDIITASTREKDGGEYHNVEGGRYPW
ncbi:NAD(P)-binding protein [Pholiota conissans]|uniref:NAD(P)-binding protein n=1 Tax=Pholiota conissans TaxID=109636 RepID=A0A9P6CVK1_9AGAR|nr:NAD(P)-binding protein [Pholiota conissans]